MQKRVRHVYETLTGYKSICGETRAGEVDLGVISPEMVVFKNESE